MSWRSCRADGAEACPRGCVDIIRERPAGLPAETRALGILSDFELRLEGVIDSLLTHAFRTRLQPVELATRILRVMDDGKPSGVHEVWVPNRYPFYMSETDRE